MSTGTSQITAEQFLTLPLEAPAELVRGEMHSLFGAAGMTRPGVLHGTVCQNVGGILWNWSRKSNAGIVVSNDTGVITQRDPDTVPGNGPVLHLAGANEGNGDSRGLFQEPSESLRRGAFPVRSLASGAAQAQRISGLRGGSGLGTRPGRPGAARISRGGLVATADGRRRDRDAGLAGIPVQRERVLCRSASALIERSVFENY